MGVKEDEVILSLPLTGRKKTKSTNGKKKGNNGFDRKRRQPIWNRNWFSHFISSHLNLLTISQILNSGNNEWNDDFESDREKDLSVCLWFLTSTVVIFRHRSDASRMLLPFILFFSLSSLFISDASNSFFAPTYTKIYAHFCCTHYKVGTNNLSKNINM